MQHFAHRGLRQAYKTENKRKGDNFYTSTVNNDWPVLVLLYSDQSDGYLCLILYMSNEGVPHWTQGESRVHVEGLSPPDVNTLLDSSLSLSTGPVHYSCCIPVHTVVCLHAVNCIRIPYITCVYRSLVLRNPRLRWSPCFSNIHFVTLCTRDLVHHSLVHMLPLGEQYTTVDKYSLALTHVLTQRSLSTAYKWNFPINTILYMMPLQWKHAAK